MNAPHKDDLAKYMERVALELLGSPNERLTKGRTEWRYGNNGSLCVDVDKGTFFDFESNKGGGVLDLIEREKGLKGRDAFEWLRSIGCDVAEPDGAKSGKRTSGKLLRMFDYTDEAGELVFQVLRYEPKAFKQRRPDGKGGWTWGTKGARTLPYKLPELRKAVADGRTIFIAEGEFKVDQMLAWGFAATCSAGGAGKWKAEHAAHLKGADVIIMPDNDDAGRRHANIVGQSLQGIAANVRLLQLPGLPHKGDIIDWMYADNNYRPLKQAHVDEYTQPWSLYEVEDVDEDPGQDIGVSADDFLAYMPEHTYIYRPTGDPWPTASVNSRLAKRGKLSANVWLDQNQHVEQMTWAPGKPELIENMLFADGAWIPRPGVSVYNRYRPAIVKRKKGKARPWLKLIVKNFGAEHARHIVYWFAWRVQRPNVKINHALLFGGDQGIGKDTILEPVRKAIGEWNCREQSPKYVLESQFNGYLQSVMLRISETRDLGESFDRFAFYECTKTMIAAPPETLMCNDKYIRAYAIINGTGVVLTTNHKAQGFYLPASDRRHFVAWSERKRAEFSDQYWKDIWAWYENGGYEIVADYLWSVDLAKWNPKAPPPQTPAFWEIVQATASSEDAELADVLDKLGRPDAVTLEEVAAKAPYDFAEWLRDRKNGRRVPHKFEQCGYVIVRNADTQDGRWRVGGRRAAIYGKTDLPAKQRVKAAHELANRPPPPPPVQEQRHNKIAETRRMILIRDTGTGQVGRGAKGARRYKEEKTGLVAWIPNWWIGEAVPDHDAHLTAGVFAPKVDDQGRPYHSVRMDWPKWKECQWQDVDGTCTEAAMLADKIPFNDLDEATTDLALDDPF